MVVAEGHVVHAPTTDACVYVCPAKANGRLGSLAATASRERFLAHLRASPPAGYHVGGVHRIAVPAGATGHGAGVGLLVELHRNDMWTGRVARVIDEVMSETGARPPMRFTSGGAILADYGPDHLLRASTDPTPSTDALRSLDGHPAVPALVAWGTVAGAVWSIESKLHGQRAKHLTRELALDLLSFCASLPQVEEPPSAPFSDLAELRFAFPEREAMWTRVERRLGATLPDVAIARHGDLWIGNLLQAKGRLRGVVDWDTFDARAMPGADLLHAFSVGDGSLPLGRIVLRRPWASDDFHSLSKLYWQTLGLSMTDEMLEAAGLAWWIGQIASSVSREPSLVADEEWTATNVDDPSDAFDY